MYVCRIVFTCKIWVNQPFTANCDFEWPNVRDLKKWFTVSSGMINKWMTVNEDKFLSFSTLSRSHHVTVDSGVILHSSLHPAVPSGTRRVHRLDQSMLLPALTVLRTDLFDQYTLGKGVKLFIQGCILHSNCPPPPCPTSHIEQSRP